MTVVDTHGTLPSEQRLLGPPAHWRLGHAHISFETMHSPRASSFSHWEKGRAAARDEGLWPIDRLFNRADGRHFGPG